MNGNKVPLLGYLSQNNLRIKPTTIRRSGVSKSEKNVLQEKAAETTKQKEERREQPKPEEQEGMPQHQHYPPASKSATCMRTAKNTLAGRMRRTMPVADACRRAAEPIMLA
jgi:hypothetical protein